MHFSCISFDVGATFGRPQMRQNGTKAGGHRPSLQLFAIFSGKIDFREIVEFLLDLWVGIWYNYYILQRGGLFTKTKISLGAVFLAAVVGFLLFTGISPLFKKANPLPLSQVFTADKGDYIEGEVHFASGEYLRVTHLIVVVPAGFDHYFLTFSDNLQQCVIIRADKGFSEQDFSEGVRISGVLRSMDTELHSKARTLSADLSELGINAAVCTYYIDTLAVRYAIMTIVCAAVFLLCGVGIIISIKRGSFGESLLSKALVVAAVADVFFGIHIIVML